MLQLKRVFCRLLHINGGPSSGGLTAGFSCYLQCVYLEVRSSTKWTGTKAAVAHEQRELGCSALARQDTSGGATTGRLQRCATLALLTALDKMAAAASLSAKAGFAGQRLAFTQQQQSRLQQRQRLVVHARTLEAGERRWGPTMHGAVELLRERLAGRRGGPLGSC
jgi:hypothetical protein